MHSKSRDTKQQPKSRVGVIRMTAGGMVAGMIFNLAFGSVVWNTEGILGGMLTGLLMYFVS